MRYDGLSRDYWTEQSARVQALVARIRAGALPADGRVLPERDDLVLGTGRRLPMSILFLDICGFSARASETAEEQDLLLRALNLFFTEMVKIAEDYEGTVEKNTGDGLMAHFPDGGFATNGATRAVAAALTMSAAGRHLIAPQLAASGIPAFEFRIGIDAGYVTLARLGAAKRYNSVAAIGTTANIACKILGLAEKDQILVGNTARSLLPAQWHNMTKPLGRPSGWTYRSTGLDYPVWRYEGRWISLT